MATHTEARSLSDLNFLAANPPQYPVNPTEQPRESLLLYISRVPGTRDLILSTFKPHLKNVTSEDVATSLYYVHLDLPSDLLLVSPVPKKDDGASQRSSAESPRSVAIPRKPLPNTAHIVPVMPPKDSVPGPNTALHPGKGQPVIPVHAGAVQQQSVQHQQQLTMPPPKVSAPIIRKPLGPRPLASASTLSENERPHGQSTQHPLDAPPAYAEVQSEPLQVIESPTRQPPLNRSPSPSKTQSVPVANNYFSLTLIRRDPASGHQWNVGRVSSFQTAIPTPEVAGVQLSPHQLEYQHAPPTIDMRIETSGYAKFRGMPTLTGLTAASSGSTGFSPTTTDGDGVFTRQVAMTYTRSWTAGLKHAFRRRERASSHSNTTDGAEPGSLSPPGVRWRRRGKSNASTADESDSGSSDGGGKAPKPVITQPGPGLKPRGYVFASPWDGRCEFRTGGGGKSVTCRHVLRPGASGGMRAAMTAVQDTVREVHEAQQPQQLGPGGGPVITSEGGTRPVSELRFNLPSGDLFKSSGASGGGAGHGDVGHARNLHGQFNKLLKLDQRFPDSSDEWDQDDEMQFDMSLGREKAGGGNRGKRAKLGKLIIHDEGLKMMDLIVAANIGIWWGVWEKSS